MNVLTSGELAERGGVNLESVRFYERQGLLPKPPRTRGGYRQFTPDAVQRVRFIKQAQRLGFTLAEIRELLTLRLEPAGSCRKVESRARAKIADIEQRLRTLNAIKRVLSRLVAACAAGAASDQCPILAALERSNGLPRHRSKP